MDEVDSNLLTSLQDFVFKKCFALEIIKGIESLIVQKCNGCQTGHGSQQEHSCLTETVVKDAHLYWDRALSLVNYGAIIFEFLTRCEAESLPLNGYLTIDALNKVETEWMEDIKMLVNIMAWRRFV